MEEDIFGNIPKDDFLLLGKLFAATKETSNQWFQEMARRHGVGLRKAYYLIEIYYAFIGLTAPKSKILEIGWTKAHALVPVVNEENWMDWIAQAKTLSTRELRERVKGNDPGIGMHCVLMYFTPQEFDLICSALGKFGALRLGRSLYGKEPALLAALKELGLR